MKREVRELDRQLAAMGFALHRDRRHRIYRHPRGGRQLVMPSTPSDARSMKNALADARRIVRELEAV